MKNVMYILASGPSIADITDEEWKFLEDKKTLGIGGFPYSNRKTTYYMNIETPEICKQYIEVIYMNGFIDTTLISPYIKSMILANALGFKKFIPIITGTALFMPDRKGWFMDEEYPPHKFKNCRANKFYQPLFRFRGSLSAAINLSLLLHADEIRLVGVDLASHEHFYNENINISKDKYDKRISSRKYSYAKSGFDFDEKTMHSTDIPYRDVSRWGNRLLRPISDVIQWMNQELLEEGHNGIFITSKKSKLYIENKLEYKSITDE